MRLLLDTHALLWWLADMELSEQARGAIASADASVFVSAASAWEIAIKRSLNKLDAPEDLEEQLAAHRFQSLSIGVRHALVAGSLPRLHEDPFDRMLIAQAKVDGLTVVTRDQRFEQYEVPVLAA